ncbi:MULTISPECIES: hypothetical protein [unclassified Bradyrhizobium]|uniref:hypothetical protein n=1 Tax=unclassified Bradyrhizobium TaxID=2631580 RepID=UPI001BD0C3EA|nr:MULTISPECIES: hypothetical protein [unclassified Bradyrhizobium]WOH52781.1 hypothetical protein RX328_12110 [Bradyrhizobium sp. sBnM-33]
MSHRLQSKTIVSYRTHRITETGASLSGGPRHYVERIEVTDRAAYEAELAVAGTELIDELYEKYLDKSKTVSVWSERIEGGSGPHAVICGAETPSPLYQTK